MIAPQRWSLPGRRGLALGCPAAVAGIINVTPDSFSDGGRLVGAEAAIAAGVAMAEAGAAWLDVGGESSRPGAAPVSAAKELARVVPVIAGLRRKLPGIALSVDTGKAIVARAALAAGADAVNDITAGRDPAMFAAVAAHRAVIVLMHMQGEPATMQAAPRYDDVEAEVTAFLLARMRAAEAAGVPAEAVVLDPGIGFGKTVAHNLALLDALPRIGAASGRPVMVGLSRKAFLGRLAGGGIAAEARDGLSHVLHALIARHCALVRVHDVAGAVAALKLAAGAEDAAAPLAAATAGEAAPVEAGRV